MDRVNPIVGASFAGVKAATATGPQMFDIGTLKFLDKIASAGVPPLNRLSYENARLLIAKLQEGPTPRPSAEIKDVSFPVGPSGAVSARIVRPRRLTGLLPVVLYFHGGGWISGNKETHDRLVREIANGANVAVVLVDYTLAPHAKHPFQVEQAYAATQYVAEVGEALGLDGSRIAVAGDGAGGNIAAVVALMAKERRGPPIRFQLLFYPVTDDLSDNASYKAFGEGPWLTALTMRYFLQAAYPKELRQTSYAFPLKASVDQLKGLPETLVIVAECDVLRDEGEAYARKLAKAGVRVTSTRYNGTIHDFVMLNALAHTGPTRAAITQANAALRSALYKL
jgi:acetyl esterase